MRNVKWLAALLALCLLLMPAAVMEDLTIDDTDGDAMELDIADEALGDDALELPPELEAPKDLVLEENGIDLSGLDLTLPGDAGMAEANLSATSLVKITKPLSGTVVSTGKVALWCTFVNEDASGGFSTSDVWKYVPLRVQVLKDNQVVSDDTISGYGTLIFTDEGLQYATVNLAEAGTYTIRVRVPGNAEDVWDSIQVTAKGASATPAPGATRAPITDENLVVITKPEQGALWVAEAQYPVRVRLRKPASGAWSASMYSPIRVEVLNSRGNLVSALDTDKSNVGDYVESGEDFQVASISVDVGGTYTLRVRAGESSAWDSVQIYAEGPAYPVGVSGNNNTITPGQSEVTIDLAKDKTARFTYSMTAGDSSNMNYVYYADFVEDGNDTIKYKAMSDNTFSYDSKKGLWVCDGWIEYTGVKVGSTTLHMYILVNGTRYDHHAVTVNVIDSSKVSAATPKPTATPKVSLSKCKFTVKNQAYTGKALKPAVTVKYGKKTLKKGTDYTVTYKDNKAVGTATATVKGKGGYSGTKKVTFKILPPAVALSKLKAGTKSFTATWKQGKSIITGYQLQYGLKKTFSGAKTVTVKKAKTVSATVKSLKSGKTYYVRVRTYKKVGKVNYYSAWSKVKSVKVK